MSRRIQFQNEWVSQTTGLIANIGCGEDPLNISGQAPDRVINLDLNVWNVPNFIQCDAHHLPLKDDAVELALLGDVLEHVVEPLDILKEAKRISKRIVATVFEDFRLPSPGRHIEYGQQSLVDSVHEHGFESSEESLKTTGLCIREYNEGLLSHGPHIWWFTVEMLLDFIKQLDMNLVHFSREPELINKGRLFFNFLFVLEKVEGLSGAEQATITGSPYTWKTGGN